jgi:hypothetical protein
MDDGPGGTLRVITPYVTDIGGVKLEALQQQTNPFGVTWRQESPIGVSNVPAITIHGFFDDTATVGPHVVMIAPDDGPNDLERTLVIVYGNSKTATMEGRLVSYEVMAKNNNLTEYAAVYKPNSLVWS